MNLNLRRADRLDFYKTTDVVLYGFLQIHSMALILVTGATGRIGAAAASALISKGHKIRAVVRPGSSKPLPAGAEKFEWDLSSGPLPKAAFSGVQYVVYLAGLVGDYPYNLLMQSNAFAVKNLLSSCPQEVQKIILASSISVYGEYKWQVVDETFAPKCESPYGKSKLLGETFARDFCGSLPIVFLRFGMVYGPGFEEGYFPVLDRIRRGKMSILGEGKNRLPLLHISDAVQAIFLALGSKSATSCREYNIVGEEKLTQTELFALAAHELGVATPAKHASIGLAKAMLRAMSVFSSFGIAKKPGITPDNIRQMTLDRAYSCARAEAELGYKARVKINDGLKDVVRDFLSKKG